MATSQNGWSVVGRSSLVNIESPGGWKVPVRKGDVAVIFRELFKELSKIDPAVKGWSWGWAPRKVRGGSSISNHASGTAIDHNAPRHPLGAVNTFRSADRAKVRALAKRLGLRWGGDYRSRKDEMHFEIIVSAAKAKQIASKISGKKPSKNPPKKTNPKKYPVIKRGQKGANVKRLQQILNRWYPTRAIEVDSVFGGDTERLVRHLQERAGLKVDGIAGEKTLKKLGW